MSTSTRSTRMDDWPEMPDFLNRRLNGVVVEKPPKRQFSIEVQQRREAKKIVDECIYLRRKWKKIKAAEQRKRRKEMKDE